MLITASSLYLLRLNTLASNEPRLQRSASVSDAAAIEGSNALLQSTVGRALLILALSLSPTCRLQNSYTASQRANQDLEEKLHALVNLCLSLT